MFEAKSHVDWQRLAPRLLATACLLMIAHSASSQALPGPDAIPYVPKEARERWERYVLARAHKAYAISETGNWSWRQGFDREEEAIAAALSACERYGSPCFLYAVNQTVVWDKDKFKETPRDEVPAAGVLPAAGGKALESRASPLQGTKLTVGRSTFAVPEGAWMVGSFSRSPPGGDTGNQIVEAYGHWVGSDGLFKAAFFHSARRETIAQPEAGTKVVWTDGTCDRSDAIIADRMHGDAEFPECLMLDFLTSPETASGDDGKIRRWVRMNGIDFQDPVISATYVKYRGGDFVRIVYWINPAALGVSSSADSDRFKSHWNPRNLDAQFIERVKAWSYEMAGSGRASLEDRAPKAEALPPFPDPDQSPLRR
jgi:hypothetical protein